MVKSELLSSALLSVPKRVWRTLEEAWRKEPNLSVEERFKVFDEMAQHAQALGKMSSDAPLRGTERVIRVARILNSVQ